MKLRCVSAIAMGIAFVQGCGGKESVDSQDIRTAGIAATIRALAESDASTDVEIKLRVGGDESNTFVDLAGGDRIFAQAGDSRVEMRSRSLGVYGATFPTVAANTTIVVSLDRAEDEDAPDNVGQLPAPIALTAGSNPASRAMDLTIFWSPSGAAGEIDLRVRGSCIDPTAYNIVGDPGFYSIRADSLRYNSTATPPGNCDITIELSRERAGVTDIHFDGESSFVLTQRREIKVTSTP